MRVIVDLVVNHTSIDHPWFQSARSSPDSPHRDWYVWSDDKPEDITKGIIFPGVQEAVWTYDRTAKSWYMHRFYKFQADLNIANPEVREEIKRIMGFWLELGVSGFRIDAVPFLIEYKGIEEAPDRDPALLLSEMRDFMSWRKAGGIMLAEANVPREQAPGFFGGREYGTDERMHMLFDFPLNQYLWLAMVRGEVGPLIDALASRPRPAPTYAQWAVFLRNHDELSLDKLSDEEKAEAFAALAPQKSMRIYDRGVRRRMAPMLDGDLDRLSVMHSLLLALPGTPVMWYGDEIGMGEDLSLPERQPVRTPMQWSDGPNGGFSTTTGDVIHPVVMDGPMGAGQTNVAAQEADTGSLLCRVEALVRARRGCPEIGWGDWEVLEAMPEGVLGIIATWQGSAVLTLHNLTGDEVTVNLPRRDSLRQIIGAPDGVSERKATLGRYGYRWFRLGDERR